MSEPSNPLRDSAILLAGVTAFLYCASTSHAGGFNATLGLDPDVLDRNFHQVLYNGFLISFGSAIIGLICYAGIRFVYSHMILDEFFNWLSRDLKNKRRLIRAKQKFMGKRRRKTGLAEREAKRHTMALIKYTGAALVFIFVLVYYEKQGKEAAEEMMREAETAQPRKTSIVNVTIDEVPRSLFHLSCGARNCAGMDLQTKMIYYFPQNGHSYQYEKRAQKKSAKPPVPDEQKASASAAS